MSSTAVSVTKSNPFVIQQEPQQEQQHMAVAASSREVAEVQSAMAVAKRFPRDQAAAYDRIMIACKRPTLAANALYSYSRGGSDVTGPSIRLAETLANAWGNIQCGIRELEQRNGESTVEAYAWDVETNTRVSKVFQVPHIRHTRTGTRKLEDPRDIYEMVANQGARRLRACILGVIPGDLVDAAVAECEQTLTATADCSPAAMTRVVAAFQDLGVSKEQIEKRIQRRMEAITPALVVWLRKVYASIKDGMSKPADWFEFESAEKAAESTTRTEKLIEASKNKKATEAAPPAETGGADEPDALPVDQAEGAEQTADTGPAFPEVEVPGFSK